MRTHLDGRAFGEGYGTHLPLLVAVVAAAPPGDVLELGTGTFSTPVLSELCRATGRRLWSLDTDAAWLARFAGLAAPHHALEVAAGWDAALADLAARHPARWAVALVDHGEMPRRGADVAALLDRAHHVVAHDSNYGHYHYEPAFARAAHRYDYRAMDPHTTVVSNYAPFPPRAT